MSHERRPEDSQRREKSSRTETVEREKLGSKEKREKKRESVAYCGRFLADLHENQDLLFQAHHLGLCCVLGKDELKERKRPELS